MRFRESEKPLAESVEPCAEVIQFTTISDYNSLPIFVVMIRSTYVSSTVSDLHFKVIQLIMV